LSLMEFIWKPDLGAEKSKKPSVSTVKFNDGYEARIPNSINPSLRVWNCTFTNNLQTANEIDEFLNKANGTTAFDWIDPQGKKGKFVCREWKMNQIKFGVFQITAVLEEVYE
ncbi:phage tail protein, partial [Acinetobacter baumannii]